MLHTANMWGLRLLCTTSLLLYGLLAVATPQSAAAKGSKSKCTYVVKKGDTLARIARRKGTSTENLLRANPALKKNPHRLRPGQSIRVCKAKLYDRSRPKKCGKSGRVITHQVGSGETLGAIAARYDTSVAAIRRGNKKLSKRNNNMIRKGESLKICTSRGPRRKESLAGGIQLPEGEGYHRRRPGNAWGKAPTIHSLTSAIALYHQRTDDSPLVEIGDISSKSGGPLGGHLSHQGGRDVDINVVFEPRATPTDPRVIDIPRSWQLLKALSEDGNLKVIFADYALQGRLYEHALSDGEDPELVDALFEYPNRGSSRALVYHWPGHRLHFHVRYRRDSVIRDRCQELPGTLVVTRDGQWARILHQGQLGPTVLPAVWCDANNPRG